MVEPQRIARARTGEMRPCHGCWQHAAVQYILKRASEGGARASTASLCRSYCLLLCWVCRVWVCPSVLSRPQGGGGGPRPAMRETESQNQSARPGQFPTIAPGPAHTLRSFPHAMRMGACPRAKRWSRLELVTAARSVRKLPPCAAPSPACRTAADALYHRCSSARPASAPTDLLSPSTCARQIAAARRERTSSGAARSLTFAIRHVYLDR